MAIRNLFSIVPARGLYRPDIDGVRALAVLAVVAYHYSPANLPGGYIGVDIFFVISGYLITGILLKAMESGEFPSFRGLLADFYRRRIRRIFPSLILILAACLVIGWLVFFSSEYADLGKYVAAGASYIENFVLWSEAGYFDHASIEKTLLHLWSLSVEEQFYIAWPLLLWVVVRRHWPLLTTIAVIAAATFALNLALVFTGHTTQAFYSPIPRTWELMTGAWLAVAHRRGVTFLTPWSSMQSLAGLALIGAGLALIAPTSAFPGFWVLLPVLGTALIVNAGTGAMLNRHVLSWRPAVWVGLISYPLYLWHWVLLSVVVTVFGDDDPAFRRASRVVLVVASMLMAWLSYRYFENPIRHSRKPFTAAALVIAVAALGSAGFAVYASSGFPDRPGSLISGSAESYIKSIQMGTLSNSQDCFNPQTKMSFLQRQRSSAALPDKWYCELGDTRSATLIFAYGDSHARAMIPTIDRYGKSTKTKVIFSSIGSCLPLLGITVDTDYPLACRELAYKMTALAKELRPKAVVLMEAWPSYFRAGKIRGRDASTGTLAFEFALDETLDFYANMGVPTVLMADNPYQRTHVPKAAIRFASRPTDEQLNASALPRAAYERQQAQANSMLEAAVSRHALTSLLDARDTLCNKKTCPWVANHHFLYYDQDHLSAAGALRTYPVFAKYLDAALTRAPPSKALVQDEIAR